MSEYVLPVRDLLGWPYRGRDSKQTSRAVEVFLKRMFTER